MDPLTHTLVGANLASTRLRERTRFATAALVVGANLPDVDAIYYFTGQSDFALGFRRGWTHGILAIAVLPLLLTALLLLIDHLKPDPARPASARWLLLLSFLAVLTHPSLDWLNNYGMRWLMPFRGDWYYGDAVYIMDPLLWLILGCGWLVQRRPTWRLFATWAFFTAAIAWVVGQRSASYLVVVAIVAAALFAALLIRTQRTLAAPALLIATIYVLARIVANEATEAMVQRQLPEASAIMASPHALDPTRWDVVVRTGDFYRWGRYSWIDRRLTLVPHRLPVAKDSPEWRAAKGDPSIRGFMIWARFPWYQVERSAEGTVVFVGDARYATRRTTPGFGATAVRID